MIISFFNLKNVFVRCLAKFRKQLKNLNLVSSIGDSLIRFCENHFVNDYPKNIFKHIFYRKHF